MKPAIYLSLFMSSLTPLTLQTLLPAAFLEIYIFMYVSEIQGRRIRELYLASLLSQEVGWHDLQTSDLAVKLTSATTLYQSGINERLGQIVEKSVGCIGGLVIAFIKGWELTLVICATAPVLALVSALMSKAAAGSSAEQQKYLFFPRVRLYFPDLCLVAYTVEYKPILDLDYTNFPVSSSSLLSLGSVSCFIFHSFIHSKGPFIR